MAPPSMGPPLQFPYHGATVTRKGVAGHSSHAQEIDYRALADVDAPQRLHTVDDRNPA